jgi:NitT/TauT family transport system ATP-binding protein
MNNIVLDVQNVNHYFGNKNVLYNINLKIAQGEIVSVVGPSGCGKSTLFRAMLGTHPAKSGKIYEGDQLITGPNRHVGIVYQQYSLFPFLTAKENVAVGLRLDGTNLPFRIFHPIQWYRLKKSHVKASEDFLEKLHLGHAKDLYPGEMSGGMRQRVAIAQALIMKPRVLLLDEPFGALDESTREGLQNMLLTLYKENLEAKKLGKKPPYTILIVTHELNEAIYVADRVIGLSQYWKANLNSSDDKMFDKFVTGEERGATIVYDKACPVFEPDAIRDFSYFLDQKIELRKAVFDKSLQDPTEHVKYWEQVKNGEATGVMAPEFQGVCCV